MLAQAEPGADAADGVVGTLSVPDGPALTVRTVTEADVEGLDALFQRLSEEDRHHRFFSLSHPSRKFVEQMTQAEDEADIAWSRLFPGPENALVAEAGYAILPDGDGEFALTVAPGWRRWPAGTPPSPSSPPRLDAGVPQPASRHHARQRPDARRASPPRLHNSPP